MQVCASVEVGRIATASVIAAVEDVEAFWNWPNPKFMRKAMYVTPPP
jgi:hypothetical protein